jgi:hypothetical protein
MKLHRSLLPMAFGIVLAHVVPACLGETEGDLNPQPLPPTSPSPTPGEDTSQEGPSMGTGGAAPPSHDAGVAGDAGQDASDGGDV